MSDEFEFIGSTISNFFAGMPMHTFIMWGLVVVVVVLAVSFIVRKTFKWGLVLLLLVAIFPTLLPPVLSLLQYCWSAIQAFFSPDNAEVHAHWMSAGTKLFQALDDWVRLFTGE